MDLRRWLPIAAALLFPAAHSVLGQTVTCASEDGEKHYCTADTRHGARMVKQTSQAPCTEGTNWGYDEEGIWVDKGCAGEFALGSEEKGDEEAPGGLAITCTSEGGGRKYCPVETQGNVQLVKQRAPELMVDGEMQADTAVAPEIIEHDYPFSSLKGAR